MKVPHLFFLFVVALLLGACDLDEPTPSSNHNLTLLFSEDTLLFDTLLSERLSITKRLRIYNPHTESINISKISISANSTFSLVIDGAKTTELIDRILLGKDSLLILVNSLPVKQDLNNPYLIKDSIFVQWNGNKANIKLLAWGQDAHYLGNIRLCDQIFTADRPYVFYDTVLVEGNCFLKIEPGSTLLFDTNAALLIAGTLHAVGSPEKVITFRNTRFDENYQIAPGQWPGINFLVGSTDHIMDFTLIENAVNGITIGTPDVDTIADLRLLHTRIQHSAQIGLAAYNSDVTAQNLLILNSGIYGVLNAAGGSYHYSNCTFVNTPNSFYSQEPTMVVTNRLSLSDGSEIFNPLLLNLQNNIIWGLSEDDLFLQDDGMTPFELLASHNLIHSNVAREGNFVFLNQEFPLFEDIDEYNYELDSASFCIDLGLDIGIVDDLKGRKRDKSPDLGALESAIP